MVEVFANSGYPDTPHSAASDLGLHCLPITRLGFSRQQWVKISVGSNQVPKSIQVHAGYKCLIIIITYLRKMVLYNLLPSFTFKFSTLVYGSCWKISCDIIAISVPFTRFTKSSITCKSKIDDKNVIGMNTLGNFCLHFRQGKQLFFTSCLL